MTSSDSGINEIRKEIKQLLSEVGIDATRVVLFGSRTRGDHNDDSDVDILLVSDDFVGSLFPQRSQQLYLDWNYDDLPAPEFVCLTREEYGKMSESESPNIVTETEEESVRLI